MNSIALLDGGLGQEIHSRSAQTNPHSLWSVKIMHEEPDVVIKVHEDFINAGAKVLTLNNYTASITRMKRFGWQDKFEETHRLAIDLLLRAIENSNVDKESINIAGCLMPLSASYVASAAHDYKNSYDEYCKVIEAQINGVDLFLVETISNINEARAAMDALRSFGQQVFLGLTLKDDLSNQLRSGESIEEALDKLNTGHLDALMINCSFPEAIDKAMPVLADTGLRIGGYANGFTSIEALEPGTTVDRLEARSDLAPEAYTEHALRWVDAGATIIGGCCEISPAHISHLKQALADAGYKIEKLL